MDKLPFEKSRELLIKAEEDTILECGCLPHKRPIEQLLKKGIINLDKPSGPTSNQVLEWVKKIVHVKKAGHAGTLDPKVSGVFPIGLDEGTKTLQALLPAGKEYIGLMHLHKPVSKNKLKEVIQNFIGKIYQKPPLKAAVKRILRVREIYYIDLLEIQDKDVLFKVGCEAGTYIRRLCHDIGLALGVGAHMQQLRRTKFAAFTESSVHSLQELIDAYYFWKEESNEKELRKIVQPMEYALKHLPRIIISDYTVDSLAHGAQLAMPGILKVDSEIEAGDLVAVFTQKGEAVILGKALVSTKHLLKDKKGFAVKTKRVLIEKGVYPKYSK